MSTFETPAVFLFTASPKSGKSVMIKYLLYKMLKVKRFNYGIVFSSTAFNNDYSFMPEEFVHSTFDEEIIKNLMMKQRSRGTGKAFVVFDDILGDLKLTSNLMIKLLSTYRHYNISIFLATQYLYKVPPTIRECYTYAFIFRQTNMRSIDVLRETYFIEFKNKHEVQQYIGKHTKDYQVIVVSVGESQEKKYKVMKAKLLKPFYIQFN